MRITIRLLSTLCLQFLLWLPAHGEQAEDEFQFTLAATEHGTLHLYPPLPAGGTYPAGTVVTLTAGPNPGYGLDSIYYSVPGRWGPMYFETQTGPLRVTADEDKTVGVLFLPDKEFSGYQVIHDVPYAKPGVKQLKYDVYAPDGADHLPCVVIIHGGGWNTNTEDIMRGQARAIVRSGRYVVFTIDYRWMGTADGDTSPNTMANLIEDVYGAIAHIQEHATGYGGDPDRIAVTGDSAGGHLSAAAAVMVDRIGDGGFSRKPGKYEYQPSYLPAGKTVGQVREEITSAIRAAAPSYGVFADLNRFTTDPDEDAAWNAAVSPIHHVPPAADRAIPHYLLRGSEDMLIRDDMVQAYAEALRAKGQRVEYIQVPGANHAFFDWKPDAGTRATFRKFGVPYAADMVRFFDTVFYPGE